MESHTEEIVLEVDATPESEALPAGEAMVRALPFSFAKRHGVLIRDIDNGVADAAYRTGTSPLSLAEARRFAGMPLRLTRVSSEAFDSLLQQTYEQGSQMAMQMVGDLDEHTDLLQVAQELPEPSDLLESDDDARTMRPTYTSSLTRIVSACASGLTACCARYCKQGVPWHRSSSHASR
jgi:general secretion pathway protein E